MPLDIVNHHFTHLGGTTAIQRSFIDMPITPGKLCLIRQVQVMLIQRERTLSRYDQRYAISVDPDHVLTSMTLLDSTIFLAGSYQLVQSTAVGQEIAIAPQIFQYPEGIKCPFTRLPFFVSNSNTNTQDSDFNVRIFFEFEKISAQEQAVAVMRRGRGVTRD